MRSAFVHGSKNLRADFRKYVLALLAMLAGTAVLFATLICAEVTNERLAEGVDSLGGIADIGLVPDAPGGILTSDQVNSIEELPDVSEVIPTYSESTTVRSSAGTNPDLVLTGYPAHFNESLFLQSLQSLDGRLPGQGEPEVLLPSDIAQSLSVGVGDKIEVLGASGTTELAVVGIVDPSELGMLAYENIFVDLSTAQNIFGEPDRLSRVDLRLTKDPSEWSLEVQHQLPAGVAVQGTSAASASFAPILRSVNTILKVISGTSFAITVLLTATAFGSVIRSRQNSYALLRTVGASRPWIARELLAEAMILGVLGGITGAIIGPLIGLGLIRVLPGKGGLPVLSKLVQEGCLCMAIAVLASFVGYLFSLRSLYKGSALAGLRTATDGISLKVRKIFGVLGSVILAAAVIICVTSNLNVLRGVSFALLLIGASLVSPSVVALFSAIFRNSRWSLSYASRRLDRENQMLAPAVIVAVIVALSASLMTVADSIGGPMNRQMESQFGADVQITSKVPVSMSDPGDISRIEGVKTVTPISSQEVTIKSVNDAAASMDVNAMSIDPDGYFSTAGLAFVQAEDGVQQKMRDGAVAVPESVARSLGVGVGDALTVSYAGQNVTAPIAGVFISMSTGTQIVLPAALIRPDSSPKYNRWYVSVADGQDLDVVRDRVADVVSAELPGSSVITGAGMLDRAKSDLATCTIAMFALVGITVIVGSIGSAGIFALSVSRRQRELATLRVVGLPTTGTGRLILSEVLLVGFPAMLTGVLSGIGAGWVLSQIVSESMGVSASFTPSFVAVLSLTAITIASLVLASYWPVRRARHCMPSMALRAE